MNGIDGQAKNPQEWLTTEQAAELFNIKASTLRGWRRLRSVGDTRYPRYHKWSKLVRYKRSEFEEDLKAMEVPCDEMTMKL